MSSTQQLHPGGWHLIWAFGASGWDAKAQVIRQGAYLAGFPTLEEASAWAPFYEALMFLRHGRGTLLVTDQEDHWAHVHIPSLN